MFHRYSRCSFLSHFNIYFTWYRILLVTQTSADIDNAQYQQHIYGMKTLGCRYCLLYKPNSANVWLFWKHGITSDNRALLYRCCQLVLKYLDNSRLQQLIPSLYKSKIYSVQCKSSVNWNTASNVSWILSNAVRLRCFQTILAIQIASQLWTHSSV